MLIVFASKPMGFAILLFLLIFIEYSLAKNIITGTRIINLKYIAAYAKRRMPNFILFPSTAKTAGAVFKKESIGVIADT